jgi:hypothetical protein
MMKLTIIYALLAAIIYTLCITQQAVADEAGKTIGFSDVNAPQPRAGGFQRIRLIDSPGGGLNALSGVRSGESTFRVPAADRGRLEGIGPDMFKVLSVIGRHTGDRKLLEKVKYKLSSMSHDRLRLAVSLSERLSDDNRGVRRDIAFFLLTTLIVFS